MNKPRTVVVSWRDLLPFAETQLELATGSIVEADVTLHGDAQAAKGTFTLTILPKNIPAKP